MKRARISYQNNIYEAHIEADNGIRLADGRLLSEEVITWLPPATGTLFALGLNYADHASELAMNPPAEPLIFIKSKGTLTGHKTQTWRPNNVDYMHYECELVAVIGAPAKNVLQAHALEYIEGYTLCNDYAIRDYLENYYRPNLRVKNRDATTPIGPYIVSKDEVPDPTNLILKTWVNGVLRQQGTTADMIFSIPYLIEYLSHFMTLQPGDMIATGTPKGVFNVVPGDEVIVEIKGIGALANEIISEDQFFASKSFANN